MAVTTAPPPARTPVVYPDSDGKPMADNTEQFRWIVLLKENLEALFADRGDVFVAGDLLWYPVEGSPRICAAPDVLVAFGRPRGYRGSYKQWEEGDVAPQVVFEILSPSNDIIEMLNKLAWYDRYQVEEFYVYDPETFRATGYQRHGDRLVPLTTLDGWVSPRLGIRFEAPEGEEMRVYRPDGARFESLQEALARRDAAEERAARLAERLRALGVDPEEAEG